MRSYFCNNFHFFSIFWPNLQIYYGIHIILNENMVVTFNQSTYDAQINEKWSKLKTIGAFYDRDIFRISDFEFMVGA